MEILEPLICNYGFEISRYMLCSNITLVMQGYAIQRQSYWNFIRKTPARTVQLCHQTLISLIGLMLTWIFLNMKMYLVEFFALLSVQSSQAIFCLPQFFIFFTEDVSCQEIFTLPFFLPSLKIKIKTHFTWFHCLLCYKL